MCVRKREIIISDGLGLLTKGRIVVRAIVTAEVNSSYLKEIHGRRLVPVS